MKKHLLRIIITITCLLPLVSVADYGEAFLTITCDKKENIFEVEPLIIWNEKLEALQQELKQGKGKILKGNSQIIKIKPNKKIEFSCKLPNDTLRVSIPSYWRDIKLYKNNNLVISPQIKNVWDFYGFIFKVRYTKSKGWEEICGRVENTKNWKPLITTRKDTNCK